MFEFIEVMSLESHDLKPQYAGKPVKPLKCWSLLSLGICIIYNLTIYNFLDYQITNNYIVTGYSVDEMCAGYTHTHTHTYSICKVILMQWTTNIWHNALRQLQCSYRVEIHLWLHRLNSPCYMELTPFFQPLSSWCASKPQYDIQFLNNYNYTFYIQYKPHTDIRKRIRI